MFNEPRCPADQSSSACTPRITNWINTMYDHARSLNTKQLVRCRHSYLKLRCFLQSCLELRCFLRFVSQSSCVAVFYECCALLTKKWLLA